jgi:flagellar basal-body rod protein FlgB
MVSITDIPLFSALKSKMSWLQARQTMLAENVANADTPGFRAHTIEAFSLPEPNRTGAPAHVSPFRTSPMHLAGMTESTSPWDSDDTETYEIKPSGNSVVLEEEMMRVAETQLDYQMATGLYSRGIGLLKTALGRRA